MFVLIFQFESSSFEEDLKKGVNLPQWICEALQLPKNESQWCNFALGLLKMMNGGSYPDNFTERGESNVRAYFTSEMVVREKKDPKEKEGPKRARTLHNKKVSASEIAFRKAWKARF